MIEKSLKSVSLQSQTILPMLTLRVTQDTFFKQSTQPSETLLINQKAFVAANSIFHVKSCFKQSRHISVQLDEEIDPIGKLGFFFEDHIQIEEVRGVWLTNVDSDILNSKANIIAGFQKLKDLGFNTIYSVVWNRGFTLYPSPVAEKFTGAKVAEQFKDRDLLAEIITAAQPHHFRVIPWFEYGLMNPEGSPLDKNKPEWTTHKNTGEKIEDGNCWLNPCHPEVQQFMTELIVQVVEKYDIDGVQLDDHFGMPASMGFDDFTKQLYHAETGGANPSLNPDSSLWKKWRINKVTSLLRQVFTAVKAKKKDCIISISPNPLEFSSRKFLADWRTWEQEGLAEELVLQLYNRTPLIFQQELEKSEVKDAHNHIPTVIGIITGQKPDDKRVSIEKIKAEVQETRDRDFAGFSFFFFGSLFDLVFEDETPDSRKQVFADLLSINQFV